MQFLDEPSRTTPDPGPQLMFPATGPLVGEKPSTTSLPATTRVLTGTFPVPTEAVSQRLPIVIKGDMKRGLPVLPPARQKKQRHPVVSALILVLVCLTLGLTAFIGTPLGREVGQHINPALFGGNLLGNQDNNLANLSAQATAVYFHTHDGYDPYYSGGQTLTDGSSSRLWPYGQCTYWANLHYHDIMGYWVPWNGDAKQWVAGAKLAHWGYSQTPHIPSIIVLMPGSQNAGYYGHVAVVFGVDGNIVHTSNMNWSAPGRVENVDFTVGPGVYFVWHL